MTEKPEAEQNDPSAVDDTARTLSPAARRALAEAEQRRAIGQTTANHAKSAENREIGGPSGPDPVRYGDWERGGIASDF